MSRPIRRARSTDCTISCYWAAKEFAIGGPEQHARKRGSNLENDRFGAKRRIDPNCGLSLRPSLASGALVASADYRLVLIVPHVTANTIKNGTMTFYDTKHDSRPTQVDVAVCRDEKMQANAGVNKLPSRSLIMAKR